MMTTATTLSNANALIANTNGGEEQSIARSGKHIQIRNVQCRDWVQFGRAHKGEVLVGHHADIAIGDSVTLHGVERNHIKGPFEYSTTFKIGEVAEYDSYNLSYTGRIESITAKSVTIRSSHSNKLHRLTWAEFSRRNRHFTVEKAFKRNSEWTD